jgi:16S rRNA (guanine1207-N2)-methyltransferase
MACQATEVSTGHYFDEQPASPSDRRTVRLSLPDVTLDLQTDRGVFSHGAIDTGTKLLLLEAGSPAASGHLLDLGCGAGPIALTMARRSPGATVWAIDVNERAVALCRENARHNGLMNVTACTPDQVPADIRFASLWSNPPIRIGKVALHQLLTTWLARVTDDGDAHLVVQRHLGADSLARWLTSQGWQVERVAAGQGFRVLRLRR